MKSIEGEFEHIQTETKTLRDELMQLRDGVDSLKEHIECRELLKAGAKRKRILDADVWINKLQDVAHDVNMPGAYADYCMYLIGVIEAELQEQEGEQ